MLKDNEMQVVKLFRTFIQHGRRLSHTNRETDSNCFRRILRLGMGVTTAIVVSGSAIAMQQLVTGDIVVTQKHRAFQPSAIEMEKNQILQILNDDGQLTHHAYVASQTFSFDSGEQQPGATVNIRFRAQGRFVVLCGIHPKMRLAVTVH